MPTTQQDLMEKIKAASTQDKLIASGGILAFIFSLFPFVGVSAGGFSASVNAWHSYAILGLLLVLAAAVVRGLMMAGIVKLPDLPLPWPRALAMAMAAGVGTVIVLLRGLTVGGGSLGYLQHSGISVGMQFGGYLLVVAGAVVTGGFVWADRIQAATPAAKAVPAAKTVPSASAEPSGPPTP